MSLAKDEKTSKRGRSLFRIYARDASDGGKRATEATRPPLSSAPPWSGAVAQPSVTGVTAAEPPFYRRAVAGYASAIFSYK